MQTIMRSLLAGLFSLIFLGATASLAALAATEFGFAVYLGQDAGLTEGVLRGINLSILALATFEVGIGIGGACGGAGELYAAVRGALARFAGAACIALLLRAYLALSGLGEGAQAGDFLAPAAMAAAAAGLMISLGLFIRIARSRGEVDPAPRGRLEPAPRPPGPAPAAAAHYALFGLAPRAARAQIRS